MQRLLALTIVLCAELMFASPGRAADPRVQLRDGGLMPRSAGIAVWANSPETTLSVWNPGAGVLRTRLQWFNVLQDAYLVTPQGVADAPGHSGNVLDIEALVGSSARGDWSLATNARSRYRFTVTSGPVATTDLPGVDFGIHLGDSGLPVQNLLARLQTISHPTYLLPGQSDARAGFEKATGRASRSFRMGPDLFLMVDTVDRKLAPRQLTWVRAAIRGAREKGIRRVFAFVHHPALLHRGGSGLRRGDAVALLRALAGGPPVTLFGARKPGLNRMTREGVPVVTVGPGRLVDVRVDDSGVVLTGKGL